MQIIRFFEILTKSTLNTAAASTKIGRLQQQLHRQELKLARLKTKQNKARQSDARLKLRLGGLLFLLGWQDDPIADIEKRIRDVTTILAPTEDHEGFTRSGQNLLRVLEKNKSIDADAPGLEEEARRQIVHHKISMGGLMVKHQLQGYDRALVLGALLNVNKKLTRKRQVINHRQ